MDNNTSEIAKLTERISKDPKSKLFVPLAEEYKKSGDIEMSIHVLSEGLKNNPGYVTARSFLGRLLAEKGDFPGAQQEFEEVVKAIPDNIMAQRKLGDLYVLQHRVADAVQQYKKVLALNPKDSETARLLAEVEAGRDIISLLQLPKNLSTNPIQKSKEAGSFKGPVPGLPQGSAATVSPAQAVVEEEAEEILVVEPLDPPAANSDHEIRDGKEAEADLVQNRVPAELDFLAETQVPEATGDDKEVPFFADAGFTEHVAESAPANGEADKDTIFALTEPAADSAGGENRTESPFALNEPADLHGIPDESRGEDPFALNEPVVDVQNRDKTPRIEDDAEKTVALFALNEPVTAAEPEIAIEEPAIPAEDSLFQFPETGFQDPGGARESEGAEKQTDDFTTDTLAELYISQGFFEKAIDIYERMLADNPTSEGLKNKLAQVHALAEAVPSEAEAESFAAQDPTPAQASVTADTEQIPSRDALPGDLIGQPRLDDWEVPATRVPAPREELHSAPRQPKPFDIGFEPREYVPPDAVLRDKVEASVTDVPEAGISANQDEPAGSTRKQAAAPETRKKQVERLESWLKNIMKES